MKDLITQMVVASIDNKEVNIDLNIEFRTLEAVAAQFRKRNLPMKAVGVIKTNIHHIPHGNHCVDKDFMEAFGASVEKLYLELKDVFGENTNVIFKDIMKRISIREAYDQFFTKQIKLKNLTQK